MVVLEGRALEPVRLSDEDCQGFSARYALSSSGSIGATRLDPARPLPARCLEWARCGRSRTSLDDCRAAAAAVRAAFARELRLDVAALDDDAEVVAVAEAGKERVRDELERPIAADAIAAWV